MCVIPQHLTAIILDNRALPMTDTTSFKEPGAQMCSVNQRHKMRKRWHAVKAPMRRRAQTTPGSFQTKVNRFKIAFRSRRCRSVRVELYRKWSVTTASVVALRGIHWKLAVETSSMSKQPERALSVIDGEPQVGDTANTETHESKQPC